MSHDRLTQLAMQLLLLGVSQSGVEQLLSTNEIDEVERQLAYLPFRKNTKRPEAFIIEAVRRRYSPPKEFYYAKNQTDATGPGHPVDEDTKPAA